MWHKRLSHFITSLTIDDDRIVGVQVQLSPGVFVFIFQIYLPCSNHSVEIYTHYIETLYDLCNMYCTPGIPIFLGDYNALCLLDKVKTQDVLLRQFLSDSNLCALNTLLWCKGATKVLFHMMVVLPL